MTNISYYNTQGPLNNKTTPQINSLIKTLRAKFANNEFTLKDVEATITPNEIGTRQNVSRIFAYYQTNMLDEKLLVKRITETTTSTKEMSKKAAAKSLAINACAKITDEKTRAEIIALIENI